MTLSDIYISKKSGKIISHSREVILFSIDLPSVNEEILPNFPNFIFEKTAENFIKYLENFSEKEIFPKLKEMLDTSARTREIKKELGIPISSSLIWDFFVLKEKFLSMVCKSSLEFANSKGVFTIKSLVLDTEKMTLKNARDFSRVSSKKNQFFIKSDSKICIFGKNKVFSENRASAEALFDFSFRKIDKI